jgi:hypothetical protein
LPQRPGLSFPAIPEISVPQPPPGPEWDRFDHAVTTVSGAMTAEILSAGLEYVTTLRDVLAGGENG